MFLPSIELRNRKIKNSILSCKKKNFNYPVDLRDESNPNISISNRLLISLSNTKKINILMMEVFQRITNSIPIT